MAGRRLVTEVTRWCKLHRKRVFLPPPLTPPKSPFAFDVVDLAGRRRFLDNKQFQEIADELHQHGLPLLAPRTVQRLTDRFARYHLAVHLESLPLLRKTLQLRGGYVLVPDATGRAGRMTLVLTDDDDSGGTGWVLLAAPIEKEDADLVRPLLRRLQRGLGNPLAGISDDSDGLRDPFREVFPGVYLLLCHFHILRAIGERLSGKLYTRFKREVDRSGVKGRLRRLAGRLRKEHGKSQEARQTLAWVEEVLAWEKADGRTFPFFWEGLEFYRRCEKVGRELKVQLSRPGRRAHGSPYRAVERILARLFPPPKSREKLARDFPLLEEAWRWFERTRKALGYRNGPVPLSPKGVLSEKALARGLRSQDWLRTKIEVEVARKSRSSRVREFHRHLKAVGEKLRERREELFAPNVRVLVRGRWKLRRFHRANGAAERKFHGVRHHATRITGKGDSDDLVQRDGAGMLVVRNLRDPEYVRTLYQSISRLTERFAKVSPEALAEAESILTRKDEFTSAREALRQQ